MRCEHTGGSKAVPHCSPGTALHPPAGHGHATRPLHRTRCQTRGPSPASTSPPRTTVYERCPPPCCSFIGTLLHQHLSKSTPLGVSRHRDNRIPHEQQRGSDFTLLLPEFHVLLPPCLPPADRCSAVPRAAQRSRALCCGMPQPERSMSPRGPSRRKPTQCFLPNPQARMVYICTGKQQALTSGGRP